LESEIEILNSKLKRLEGDILIILLLKYNFKKLNLKLLVTLLKYNIITKFLKFYCYLKVHKL